MIDTGKVKINEKRAEIGDRVDKNDKVWYNGKIIPFFTEFTYLLFNKPRGYVCSRRQQGENPTIYSILPKEFFELKTVGRLDADSEGLILLTNDGDFAFRMTHPKFSKTKIYHATLDRELLPEDFAKIEEGVEIFDGISKLKLKKIGVREYEVEMHEGRNRQIRRTFAARGYEVERLKRLRFGEFELGEIPAGGFRRVQINREGD